MNLNARNHARKNRPLPTLADILAQDANGLLANIAIKTPNQPHSNLISQFIEINDFFKQYGKLPSENSSSAEAFEAKKLARRLMAFQHDKEKIALLKPYDSYNLLKNTQNTLSQSENKEESQKKPKPSSIADILGSDSLGLLASKTIDITLLTENSAKSLLDRASPDQYSDELVATRKIFEDFDQFSAIFTSIHRAIQQKQYQKMPFSSVKDIKEGSVFVLNGILCYVASIYQAERRKNERNQERLQLIFANGTESNMLIRSLASAQYRHDNSYQVLITAPDWQNLDLLKGFSAQPITDITRQENDKPMTGVIYVARLKQPRPELVKYIYLHKIGFSKNMGQSRIKDAQLDPTFLFSEVEIIAEWALYHANPNKVEYLLHQFFHEQRLNMTLDINGKIYHPNEWFEVDVAIIDQALEMILNGKINKYYFDKNENKILTEVTQSNKKLVKIT